MDQRGENDYYRGVNRDIALATHGSMRGIHHRIFRDFNITPEDLNGLVVLDLGSGWGGLAKSMAVEDEKKAVRTTVISCNPAMRVRDPEKEREITERSLERDYPGITVSQMQHAQAVHDRNLVVAYADALPLKDESVDAIFNTYGPDAFMVPNESYYRACINEQLRVLRKGGKIYLHGLSQSSTYTSENGYMSHTPIWQSGIPQKVLGELGAQYEVMGDPIFAAIITK